MSLSRRSVLRNLGVLSAVPTLSSLNKCFALQSGASGAGPGSDSVLVLFEGPWLVSDVKSGEHKGDLMALSLPDPHVCQMGLWDSTSKDANPPLVNPVDSKLECASLANDAVFTGTRITPHKMGSSTDVFDVTYHRPNPLAPPTDSFVYIRKKQVEPRKMPGDRVIYLPVPDATYVAGQIPHWTVNDTSSEKLVEDPATARMYITVIFEYKATKASPTSISLTDGSGTHFEVKSTNTRKHLIFRLTPGVGMTGDDQAHVQAAFAALVQRAVPNAPTSISVTPGALSVVVGPNANGLSADELGIDPTDVIPDALPPKPGTIAPRNLDFPSCQGGGMVISG